MDRHCLVCGETPTSSYTYPVSMEEALKWQKMLTVYVPVAELRHRSCVCNKHIRNSQNSQPTEEVQESASKRSQLGVRSKDNNIDEQRLSVSFKDADAIHYFGRHKTEAAAADSTLTSDSTLCEATVKPLNRKLGCTQLPMPRSETNWRTPAAYDSTISSVASEEFGKRSTSGLDIATSPSRHCSSSSCVFNAAGNSKKLEADKTTCGAACSCGRACPSLRNFRTQQWPQQACPRRCPLSKTNSSGIPLRRGSERIPQLQPQWQRQQEQKPKNQPQWQCQHEQNPQSQQQWQRQQQMQPIQQQWQHRQQQHQGCQCCLNAVTCDRVMQCPSQEFNSAPQKCSSAATKYCELNSNTTLCSNFFGCKSKQSNRTTPRKVCSGNSTKTKFEQDPINVLVMGGSMVPSYYTASDSRQSMLSEICVLESDLAHEGAKFLDVDKPQFTVCRAATRSSLKVEEKESDTEVLLVGKASSIECTCTSSACKDPCNSEAKSQATLDCSELLKNQETRMQELESLLSQQQKLQQSIQSKLNELHSTTSAGKKLGIEMGTGNTMSKSSTMGSTKMK